LPRRVNYQRVAFSFFERRTEFFERLDAAFDTARSMNKVSRVISGLQSSSSISRNGSSTGFRFVGAMDVIVNVPAPHRRAEVDVKLEQIFRQHIAAGINLRDDGGWFVLRRWQMEFGNDIRRTNVRAAGQSGWTEHRPIRNAPFQRKLRLKADRTIFNPVTPEHGWHAHVGDEIPLAGINGKEFVPVIRLPVRLLKLPKRLFAEANNADSCQV
jgi:hypothetical protein